MNCELYTSYFLMIIDYFLLQIHRRSLEMIVKALNRLKFEDFIHNDKFNFSVTVIKIGQRLYM